jgi:ubiquinone/menaquinone biosynthesis C-methylase UbiE
MERIPEPDLMDDDDQAEAYHRADFSEPHNHFVTLFGQQFEADSWHGPVLDLGCGTADVTLRFADAFDAVEIDGIDGAESMLRLGREAVRSRALAHRVRLSRAYLPRENPPRRRYGAVISNSLLHHLHEPMVLWSVIKGVAVPGAPVLVMDLLRPADIRQVDQFVMKYASDAPERLQRDFRNSLHAAYRVTEVEVQLQEAGLGHLRVSTVSDRHLIVAGRA